MRSVELLRSLALIGFGAGMTAVGVFLGQTLDGTDPNLVGVQVEGLVVQLRKLEDAFRSARTPTDGASPAPFVVEPAIPSRVVDLGAPLEALIEELRVAVRALTASATASSSTQPAGIEKNTDALSHLLSLDGGDVRKLQRRHFCATKAQVHASYGTPDMVEGKGPTFENWHYRVGGEGPWVVFSFADGEVREVTKPVSNR